jgi:hypothetical protein
VCLCPSILAAFPFGGGVRLDEVLSFLQNEYGHVGTLPVIFAKLRYFETLTTSAFTYS